MTLPNSALLIRVFGTPRHYLYFSGLILLAGLALSLGDASRLSPWPRVIVGLAVFILPGGYLFALIPARDSWDLIDFVGYGFAFSIALITVLGLITRTFALTIDVIEFIWHALALLGFAALIYRSRAVPKPNIPISTPILALLAIVLIQCALFVRVGAISAARSDDRDRHHAETNSFLRDDPLGWAEPYYETGNQIADRMYLTYWTLAQALVVEISGVPIILSRYLIQPFVIVMAASAIYVFTLNLGHRRKTALLVVIASLFAYSLVFDSAHQPGSQLMTEAIFDKSIVGFALGPLAISSAFLCIRVPRWRSCFAFALTMLAATFTHALVAGFVLFIIIVWCLVQFLTDKPGRRQVLLLSLLTLVIFSPAVFLRITTGNTTIYNFRSETIDARSLKILALDLTNPLEAGNRAYMIHPGAAGDLTYVLIVLASLSLLARPVHTREKLLLAFVLAISMGLLPFTASIYGRLVSIPHIIRVLWLMPYGYMLFFVIETGLALMDRRMPRARRLISSFSGDRALAGFCLMALLLTAVLMQRREIARFSHDVSPSADSWDLLAMSEYLDLRHDDRVWIAASPEHRDKPISMSWKAIALSRYSIERMVYYSRLPVAQAALQESDNYSLFSGAVAVEDKLEIIDKYDIKYLLFHEKYAWVVDSLYQVDKSRFELIHKGDSLRLVRVH